MLLLYTFAFLAGLVDSVVGGGGLIQIPALMILLPGQPIPNLWGTNKLAAVFGTSFASYRYARHVQVDLRVVTPAAAIAFVFSVAGSRAVTLLRPDFLRPIVLVLLIVVAAYVFFVKDLGLIHQPKHALRKAVAIGLITGAAIGFYDGFFGPGTGSFLIFVFISVFGFDFLAASASAKLINVATNLASALFFIATGHVLYRVALPMAACNILGAFVGTRLAILKGSRFVRLFFIAVVAALVVRLAQQLF